MFLVRSCSRQLKTSTEHWNHSWHIMIERNDKHKCWDLFLWFQLLGVSKHFLCISGFTWLSLEDAEKKIFLIWANDEQVLWKQHTKIYTKQRQGLSGLLSEINLTHCKLVVWSVKPLLPAVYIFCLLVLFTRPRTVELKSLYIDVWLAQYLTSALSCSFHAYVNLLKRSHS